MNINVKSKFDIGDRVARKECEEVGTVTSVRFVAYPQSTEINYGVVYDGGGYIEAFEGSLEMAKSATPKFKVGDRVVLKDSGRMDGHESVMITDIGHWLGKTSFAVQLDATQVIFAYSESELLPFVPVSPHYFQD